MPPDYLQTFFFQNSDIRGAIVSLEQSLADMFMSQTYNLTQKDLLAEFAAASILLSSHIKFEGRLTLQARGGLKIPLIMAECTNKQEFRGVVQGDGYITDLAFNQIFCNSVLAITITPEKGQQYQGVVPLQGNSLAECLEDYFRQSEQLPSRFFFYRSSEKITGIMLQAMPARHGTDEEQRQEDWDRVNYLASTMTCEEAVSLTHNDLLYRLYHQESILLIEPKPVRFLCSCSRQRMESSLFRLGREELVEITAQDEISTQCHFCNTTYNFSKADILRLLKGAGGEAVH